jgi:hypothetical protein
LLDYVNPNPKIIVNGYQAECTQNEFPLDSLFQFPSFYHGEKMRKVLLSELVHEAAVQGGFCLVFLCKIVNSDKAIVQQTIGCVKYKVYGVNKKKVHNANKFKGKHIGTDKLQVGGIKKRQLRGESMKCAIWME